MIIVVVDDGELCFIIFYVITLICISTCSTEAQTDLRLRLFTESRLNKYLHSAALYHQMAKRQTDTIH